MALHELATNAAKYGALSSPQGRVRVQWRLDCGQFEMSWQERGGPPVLEPTQTGFGTVLISRVLQAETRGRVTADFDEQGFVFRLTAPLEGLEPNGREGSAVT